MRTIAITGGKGGTGKSNLAINLGVALNNLGKDVIIVDANLTTPDIGLYLGSPINKITLHDALKGKKHITKALYLHHSGAKIIPGSISLNSLTNINPDKLQEIIPKLSADFILLDTAAGLGREALAGIKSSNEIIIITNPELSAVTDALKTIRLCKQLKKKVIGVVVAKTNPENIDLSLEKIESMLETPILAIIPEDILLRHSIAKKEPVIHLYPKSPSAIAYKNLAASLTGIKHREQQEEKSILEAMADFITRWLGLKD